MSATLTVNRTCSRCPREERTEVSLQDLVNAAKADLDGPKALRVVLDGEETVVLENLCSVCRQIVRRHLDQIDRRLRQRSSLRDRDGAEENDHEDPTEVEVTVDS